MRISSTFDLIRSGGARRGGLDDCGALRMGGGEGGGAAGARGSSTQIPCSPATRPPAMRPTLQSTPVSLHAPALPLPATPRTTAFPASDANAPPCRSAHLLKPRSERVARSRDSVMQLPSRHSSMNGLKSSAHYRLRRVAGPQRRRRRPPPPSFATHAAAPQRRRPPPWRQSRRCAHRWRHSKPPRRRHCSMRLADALHAWNLSLCHRPEAPRWHRLHPRGSSFSLTLQPSVQR